MFSLKTNTQGTRHEVSNLELQCKEEWIFHAHILGLLDNHSPARAFIEYMSENYPTVDFYRQAYVVEEGYFREPCGLNIGFLDKDDAERYAEELNSKFYTD